MARMTKARLTNDMLLCAYRIREFRKKKYPTAKEAALGFSATPSQWTNWESALCMPFPSTLTKMADYLGVTVEDFSREPENWSAERKNFLADLRRRSRRKKDWYVLPEIQQSAPQQPQAADSMDETDIFLEIVSLINDARKQVKKGTIAKETYDKNIKLLADLIELASNA